MTSPEHILSMSTEDQICTITLQREAHLNAFDSALAIELLAALRTANDDPGIRVVVVTGAASAFSAGQDIFELEEGEATGGAAAVADQLRRRLCPLITAIRNLEKPVIAQINGVAAGAGLGVALACDFRIAASTASCVMSPIGIGLIPGVGLSFLVPRLIGVGPATELFMLGSRVGAERALQLGLVHRVVPDPDLRASALALAAELAAQPREVLSLTKQALNHSIYAGLEAHLDEECRLQEIAAATEEHRTRLHNLTSKSRHQQTRN
ncbi:MAG: enoyl-CoA hydratase/isomerase family protein [Thermomicrobiales bacterium]|nr:enoyl-CoA hydratase/isomerase family protein [Thermomicrobiales bacterium]